MNLDRLNEAFKDGSARERLAKLYQFFAEEDVLFTSSFGIHAATLLHMLSQVNPQQSIHFIDTGYHFKETQAYKTKLQDMYQLKVVEVHPDPTMHQFTQSNKTWENASDLCCTINKVSPLAELKPKFKIWVSGLRKAQTQFRSNLDIFTQQGDLIKFAPMIDMDAETEKQYRLDHAIPDHPLLTQGYGSVGCTHCTVKGEGRSGRWQGKTKAECGLHTVVTP